MKTALIAPRSSYWKGQFIRCEPMGLAYVAAAARAAGHDVLLIQQLADNLPSDEEIVARVRAFQPDVVGISALSDSHQIARALARKLRTATKAPMVFGGKHASIHPQIAGDEEVDVAVLGEGERTFCEILERWDGDVESLGAVRGVAFRRGDQVVQTGQSPRIKDLDALPFPWRDPLPMDRYRMINLFTAPASQQRLGSLVSSRGCVHDCIFCPTPSLMGRRWHARSAANAADEIELLLDRHNINFLLFHDEDVLLNRARSLELCREMIRRGFPKRLAWGCETNISNIDDELVEALAASRCTFLSFGIESGSQQSLDRMRKKTNLAQIKTSLERVRRRGIQTNGNVIIGFPWEDERAILDGGKVIDELPMDTLALNVLVPIQGSEIHEIAVRENLLVDRNYHNWHQKQAVMNTRHLTAAQVDRLYRLLNRRFYFRWRSALRLLLFGLRRPVYLWGMAELFWHSVRSRLGEF